MTETARLEMVIDASKAKVGTDNLNKSMDGLLTVTGKVTVSLDGVDKRLDEIAASTRSTAQGTDVLTKGLSTVSLNGQKTNEILERLAGEIRGVSAQARENSRQTLELAKAQAVAEASTNDLNRSMKTLGTTAKAVSEVYVGSDGLIHRYRDLSAATGALTSRSTATAVASKGLARSLDDLSRSASVVRGPLSGLLTGLSAVFILRDASKTISGFEASLATLRGVTGISADSGTFKSLNEQARELGATTRFTAQEAAEGQVVLARAGFDAREVLASMGPVLNLAAAGNIDLATSTDISANAIRQFNLDASETGRVVDSILNTSNNSNTGIIDLGEALKFAGTVSSDFNADIEETNALLGVLADRGIKGTLAGTGVRGVFARLADPSNEASNALRQIVGDLDLVDVKARGIVPVLETLRAANFDVVDAFQVFGRLQAGPALALIQNIDRVKELIEIQRDGIGVTEKVAKIQNDTLRGSYLTLRSAVEEAFLATGDAGLAGAMRSLTNAGTGAIRILTGTAKEAELADAGAKSLAISLKFAGFAAAGLVTVKLITYLNGVRVAFLAAAAAGAANPIGAIATGFVLAGSAVYSFLSVLNETADPFAELNKKTKSLADTLDRLKSTRIDLRVDGKSGDQGANIKAELEAVRDARRTFAAGGNVSVLDLEAILRTEVVGSEALVSLRDTDRIAEAAISDIISSLEKAARKGDFSLTAGLIASKLTDLDNSVLDVDNPFKAAERQFVRGTSFVDEVPETLEERTARGALRRRAELRRLLEEAAANGKDITDAKVVIEAIKESGNDIIRATAAAADGLAKEKQDILTGLAEGIAGEDEATSASRVLTADVGDLLEQVRKEREEISGVEKTRLQEVNEAIDRYIETAKRQGVLDEELTSIQKKQVDVLREEAKALDDAVAAAERREIANEAAKKSAVDRANAEKDLKALLTEQTRSLAVAQFETNEQQNLAIKLTDLGVKATKAGVLITSAQTLAFIAQEAALQKLNRERELGKKLVTEAFGLELPEPLTKLGIDPFADSDQFVGDDPIKDARRRLNEFRQSFSDEKLFLGADIEAARFGRPEDSDLFRDRILAGRELNELLRETGDLESEAGNAARSELQQSINEIASLREELRLVGEERAFFEDLGQTGAQAFEDIAFSAESLRETLAGLIEDVGRLAFSQLATKPLAGLLTNGLSSLFGGLTGGNGLFNVLPNAMGGILPGSLDFRAMASGGIATRPTLALIREAGQNEAVVPLPDGRKIPVDLNLRGLPSAGGSSSTTNSTTINNYNVNVRSRGGGSGGRTDNFRRSDRQIGADIMRGLRPHA